MSSDTSGIDHWLKSLITYRSYILKEGTVDFEWAMCDVSAEGSPKNLRKPFFPVKCDFTQIFGLRTESYLSFFNNVSHPKFCGSVLFFTLGRRVQQMTCCCASLISYFFQELISHKYHLSSFTPLVICYNVLLHIRLQAIYLGQSQFQESCDKNCKCDTKMHLLCWRQRKQLMKDSFSSLLKLDFERQCCPYCLLWLMCSVLYYLCTWLLQNRALPTNLPTSWMSRPVPVLPWDRL